MINKEPLAILSQSLKVNFTNNCRNAMKQVFLDQIYRKPDSCILIPSYIGLSIQEGSGVFDPLLDSGLSYQFYSVNDHLEPNLDDIKEMIKKGLIDSMLSINDFGKKPRNLDEIID